MTRFVVHGGRRGSSTIALVALAVLCIAAGATALFYPYVSNLLAERAHRDVIYTQSERVAELRQQEIDEAWAAAQSYNETLAGDPVHDPFVPGSGYALPENYEQVLNVAGDGVMGSIDIPSVDIELPIYHGTSEEVLQRGVGHIEQTALPIGGEGTHTVLTGHRGLPSAELFTRLDEVEAGDIIYIDVLDTTLCYRVTGSEVIEPSELDSLAARSGEDLLTLVTCTPYGVNTHRLLVHAERCEYVSREEAASSSQGNSPQVPHWAIGVVAGLFLLAVAYVTVTLRRRARRRRGKHAKRR